MGKVDTELIWCDLQEACLNFLPVCNSTFLVKTGSTMMQTVQLLVENLELMKLNWPITQQNGVIIANMEAMETMPDSS